MASIVQRFWSATMAATRAFQESFTQSSPLQVDDEFSKLDARRIRYAIYWAMYENTAYRKLHNWAEMYKTTFGLYRFIRNIYNPSYRLGEFWQAPLAGDGSEAPSALPIETEFDNLRPAIAKLWTWSNWQTKKGIVTLRGSVLGDTVIKVVDDVRKKRVYLEPVHPGMLSDVTLDKWGNVKAYVLEEERYNDHGQKVVYKETADRDGDNVVYRTFSNGSLYPWDGESAEWEVAYGFIPMVVIQHKDVGLPWGWSEMHSGITNFREVDDQASLLNDQIRKVVNPVWLFSGVDKPKAALQATATQPTTDNPEAARENMNAMYGPVGAGATPLVAPLDVVAVSGNIESIIKKIERDYPELSEDLQNASGDVSGRALRINRQPVIAKIQDRRPGYDNALVRAQQMALAIGGWRQYDPVFSGVSLDSYGSGKLDHSIKQREVFPKDPLDDIEVEQAFWTAAGAAKDAGIPLTIFLKRNGWTDEQLKEYEASTENQARISALEASVNATQNMAAGQGNQNDPRGQRPGQQPGMNGQQPPAEDASAE